MSLRLKAKVDALHTAEQERWREAWRVFFAAARRLAPAELRRLPCDGLSGWEAEQRWERELNTVWDALLAEEAGVEDPEDAALLAAVREEEGAERARIAQTMPEEVREAWERFGKAYYGLLAPLDYDVPDLTCWPASLPLPPEDPTPYLRYLLERFAEAEEGSPRAYFLVYAALTEAEYLHVYRRNGGQPVGGSRNPTSDA